MSLSFHKVHPEYTFWTSLILNIGNSDFGFVSYFVLRIFWVFSPRNGRTLPGPPIESVGLDQTNGWCATITSYQADDHCCRMACLILDRASGESVTEDSNCAKCVLWTWDTLAKRSNCRRNREQNLHMSRCILIPIRLKNGSLRSRDSETMYVTSLQLNIQWFIGNLLQP